MLFSNEKNIISIEKKMNKQAKNIPTEMFLINFIRFHNIFNFSNYHIICYASIYTYIQHRKRASRCNHFPRQFPFCGFNKIINKHSEKHATQMDTWVVLSLLFSNQNYGTMGCHSECFTASMA